MQTEEFLTTVQNRAALANRDQAAEVAEAVLAIFGQLKVAGEIDDAASQLPKEVAHMLAAPEAPEKFDADEFIARVQSRLGVSRDEADLAATAVLSTISTAVTEGQRVEFVNQLPKDFSRFTTVK